MRSRDVLSRQVAGADVGHRPAERRQQASVWSGAGRYCYMACGCVPACVRACCEGRGVGPQHTPVVQPHRFQRHLHDLTARGQLLVQALLAAVIRLQQPGEAIIDHRVVMHAHVVAPLYIGHSPTCQRVGQRESQPQLGQHMQLANEAVTRTEERRAMTASMSCGGADGVCTGARGGSSPGVAALPPWSRLGG
jgi:hypothetical protein